MGDLGFSVSDTAKSLRHLWAACKALTEQDVPNARAHKLTAICVVDSELVSSS